MKNLFNRAYENKKVFVTGHTGFKGSWLSLWLNELGAKTTGYSLPPLTDPNHFELLKSDMGSILADIREKEKLIGAIKEANPDIIFHMAAQPLVRFSYKDPVGTFETNIIGTVNLLEACRYSENTKAVLVITSDKCYENREWLWGYRENDSMGGYDPYSASKGCAELVTASYRNSFFHLSDFGKKHQTLIASCRAGNVLGGGDWSEDRLIPDVVEAAAKKQKALIRNPDATRPWQHIIELLYGYLLLGQKLLEGKQDYAEAWNFGPKDEDNLKVSEVVKLAQDTWDSIDFEIDTALSPPHEANLLRLDCSKAHSKLGWKPVWDAKNTVINTVMWYREFYENGKIMTLNQLNNYCDQI